MISIGKMLEAIDGLRGTSDLTTWEDSFVSSCMVTYGNNKLTVHLSAKQVEIIEQIYRKHFA